MDTTDVRRNEARPGPGGLILGSLLAAALMLAPSAARAFPQESCGQQSCQDCHQITRDEAKAILGNMVDDVLEINVSEIKGLWELVVLKSQKKIPIYLDFSRSYIVSGQIVKLQGMQDITGTRYMVLNKVDVSQIPLDDALVLGKATAKFRIIVFEDPECPFCHKLLAELKDVAARKPEVAFYIKMNPLQIHPTAYAKAKAIVCAKSLAMLESSLEGKEIPPPACKTEQLEANAVLARQLGINSVPTLVYPDGMVVPGFAKADKIIELLELAKSSLP